MSDNLKYIDDFYKSNLLNHEEEAGSNVWKKLYWSLFWLRYRWLLITGLFLLLGVAGYWLMPVTQQGSRDSELTGTQSDVTDNNKISNTTGVVDNSQAVSDLISKKTAETLNAYGQKQQLPVQTKPPASVKSAGQTADEGVTDKGSVLTDACRTALKPMKKMVLSVTLILQPDTVVLGANRKIAELTSENRPNRFMISVFSGVGFSNPAISGFNDEYVNYRNNHENSEPGWTAGIDFRYRIKNWIIGTGVSFNRYNQYRDYKFNYNVYDPANSYYDYDTTFVWIYDDPVIGKPIIKSVDSTWVKVYTDSIDDHSGYNRLSYIEVPFFFGYHFQNGNFGIELSTGLSVGFLTGSKYKIPLQWPNCTEPVEITDMNKLMLNYLASVTINYKVGRNTSLFIRPQYKQNLLSVFNKDFPVNEKFKTFGLNLGFSFEF